MKKSFVNKKNRVLRHNGPTHLRGGNRVSLPKIEDGNAEIMGYFKKPTEKDGKFSRCQ